MGGLLRAHSRNLSVNERNDLSAGHVVFALVKSCCSDNFHALFVSVICTKNIYILCSMFVCSLNHSIKSLSLILSMYKHCNITDTIYKTILYKNPWRTTHTNNILLLQTPKTAAIVNRHDSLAIDNCYSSQKFIYNLPKVKFPEEWTTLWNSVPATMLIHTHAHTCECARALSRRHNFLI